MRRPCFSNNLVYFIHGSMKKGLKVNKKSVVINKYKYYRRKIHQTMLWSWGYSLGQQVKNHLSRGQECGRWGPVLPPGRQSPSPVPEPSSHQPHSGSSRHCWHVRKKLHWDRPDTTRIRINKHIYLDVRFMICEKDSYYLVIVTSI